MDNDRPLPFLVIPRQSSQAAQKAAQTWWRAFGPLITVKPIWSVRVSLRSQEHLAQFWNPFVLEGAGLIKVGGKVLCCLQKGSFECSISSHKMVANVFDAATDVSFLFAQTSSCWRPAERSSTAASRSTMPGSPRTRNGMTTGAIRGLRNRSPITVGVMFCTTIIPCTRLQV